LWAVGAHTVLGMKLPFIAPVNGISFRLADAKRARPKMRVVFRHHPQNPHDRNAIGVHLEDGSHIGYLPAPVAARLVAAGMTRLEGTVDEILGGGDNIGIRVRVERIAAECGKGAIVDADPGGEAWVFAKSGRQLGRLVRTEGERVIVETLDGTEVAYPQAVVVIRGGELAADSHG